MTAIVSVITTTYRRPDALRAVLRGLAAQTDRGFEVVVADDGSGEETRSVVESANDAGPLRGRVVHAWQRDEGFRAARCRNLAARAAGGEILVLLDGDCIPRPGFIAAHRRCRPGRILRASRCLLDEDTTRRVLEEPVEVERLTFHDWIGWWRRRRVNRLPHLAGNPFAPLGRRLSWRTFRTCNASVHRRDFEAVDGFDHAFRGWGYEDSDLAIRLQAHGAVVRAAGPAASVIHLWHPEADRSLEGENRARLDAVRSSGRVRAVEGLSTLDPGG